jgi:hypothetical protein
MMVVMAMVAMVVLMVVVMVVVMMVVMAMVTMVVMMVVVMDGSGDDVVMVMATMVVVVMVVMMVVVVMAMVTVVVTMVVVMGGSGDGCDDGGDGGDDDGGGDGCDDGGGGGGDLFGLHALVEDEVQNAHVLARNCDVQILPFRFVGGFRGGHDLDVRVGQCSAFHLEDSGQGNLVVGRVSLRPKRFLVLKVQLVFVFLVLQHEAALVLMQSSTPPWYAAAAQTPFFRVECEHEEFHLVGRHDDAAPPQLAPVSNVALMIMVTMTMR